MKWIKSLISLVLLGMCFVTMAATTVQRLRVNDLPNQWQFVFDANKPVQYKKFFLRDPYRLVLDMQSVRWLAPLPSSLWRNTGVSQVRLGDKQGNNRRVVFDLKSDYVIDVQRLAPAMSKPYRLVINIAKYRKQSTVFKREQAIAQLKSDIETKLSQEVKSLVKPSATKPRPTQTASRKTVAKPKPIMVAAPRNTKPSMRKVIIVIDPGHGGKDPGATGQRGTHEKHVVLSISRQLQRLINKQPGFKAVLTRNGDYYLSLRKRLAIARKYKADMFIAIHADAFKNRKAHGASVYALSERGATSEAARWLAQRENKSELMGGVDLADKGHLLRSVLIDLSQTATISASLKIGDQLLSSLRRVTKLHHSVVEQAAFVVLKSPDIPSLLVETGFISNWREEAHLRNRRYQIKLANALMQGIRLYFVRYPPRGSWLAYQKQHQLRYVVHRGDTLSEIAERYAVSVDAIKQNNQLKTQRLRIGQVLIIPKRAV